MAARGRVGAAVARLEQSIELSRSSEQEFRRRAKLDSDRLGKPVLPDAFAPNASEGHIAYLSCVSGELSPPAPCRSATALTMAAPCGCQLPRQSNGEVVHDPAEVRRRCRIARRESRATTLGGRDRITAVRLGSRQASTPRGRPTVRRRPRPRVPRSSSSTHPRVA